MRVRFYPWLGLVMLLTACAAHKVQYVDPMDGRATSTGLSHADFKRLCENIVEQMGTDPTFFKRIPERSVLLLSSVQNQTYDRLDGIAFAQTLRQAMLGTGKFTFVNQRQLDDLLDQWEMQKTGLIDRSQTFKAGSLLNARYICFASVLSSLQHQGRVKDVSHMLSLELTDVTNGEIVWEGQADIRKIKKRPLLGI